MITLGSPKMSVEAVDLQRSRLIKRQRHEAGIINVSTEVPDHEGRGQDARKKGKVMVDERWRDNNKELKAAAAAATTTTTTVEEKRKACREVAATEVKWPWSDGRVDEQMSWALHCLPCWDVEYVSLAYNELYGDVAWDDDIWGIKGIHQVPNSIPER